MSHLRVEVMHGVNLDQLGRRNPEHYGGLDFDELQRRIGGWAEELELSVRFFQTNHEGAFVERLHGLDAEADGIILNPGAWTQIGELRVKLGPAYIDGEGLSESLAPGHIHVDRRSVRIGTASQPVRLGQVQAPGKKLMNAVDWARGARLEPAVRAS